jgi:hypothetical protein
VSVAGDMSLRIDEMPAGDPLPSIAVTVSALPCSEVTVGERTMTRFTLFGSPHGGYLCAAEPTIADLFPPAMLPSEVCACDLNRWTNVAGWAQRLRSLSSFKPPFELLAMQDAELVLMRLDVCIVSDGRRVRVRTHRSSGNEAPR